MSLDDRYDMEHPVFLGDYGLHEVPGFPPIFFCRGAWSIDQAYRRRRQEFPNKGEVTWWPDEELSHEVLEKAIGFYKESKPEIVVTHECPHDMVQFVTNPEFCLNFGFPPGTIKTRTNLALQAMWEAHKPKLWAFGHYHARWDEAIDGTRFICLDMIRGINDGNHAYFDLGT